MIERLSGQIVHREGGHVVIDVNGVGYGAEMPETAARSMAPSDAMVTLWIRTYVREDVIRLFGFTTVHERLLFDALTALNRVGPKNAMAILSHLSTPVLIDAIQHERTDVLDDVPGVGAQLAKSIVLGLKPKLAKLIESGALRVAAPPRVATLWDEAASAVAPAAGLPANLLGDVRAALEGLGYKEREYAALLREFEQQPPARDFQGLVKYAIAALSGKARVNTRAHSGDALEEVF